MIALSTLMETSLAVMIITGCVLAFLWFIVHFQNSLGTLFKGLANFGHAHFGANWRTSLTAAGTALMALLAMLSGLSYQLGPLADIIPPKAKASLLVISTCSATLLHILNGLFQKDRNVTGGSVQQDTTGQVIPTRRIVVEDETTGTQEAVQPATPTPPPQP